MSRRTKQRNTRPIQRNNAATIERDRVGNVYYGEQGIQGNPLYGYGGKGRGTITLPASVFSQMLKSMAPQKNPAQDFAPGAPLRPYQGVVPLGGPRQWSYNVGTNLTYNDRTEGHADIPSFAQLRSFAQLYDGVGICERVILDMIPKLEPQVTVRKHLAEQGAKDKHFEEEISEWRKFLEKPSPAQNLDIHSWLRMAFTEQTQIDALAIFKHKNRGGRLYGLEIIDGSTIKPILNERGMVPDAAQGFPAYQQYPYGVPGDLYTADDLFYYRESPRAFSAFGFSRIERVITRVNQALRKEQKDLAYFTEGNLPLGIMQVPEASTWTPDQIDAYEQAWNALIAGNQQQQVRTKFTQPGMEYIPIDQYPLDPIFDRFILNHLTAAYGLSMGDISFTEDIHKSSGDTQQNMMYRRTLAPLITIYAWILTQALQEAYHEDRFIVTFSGYMEQEDINTQAEAYQKFINVGAISPASVARLMKFPAIPETGPLLITATGITPLSNFEEGSEIRQAHEALAAAGHDASALLPETLQGASSDETPTTSLPLAKNTAKSDSDANTARSEQPLSLVERQLAELLERVDSLNSKLVRYDPAHDTQTGQFSPYKAGQQLASTDSEKVEEETHTGMMVAFMLKPETAKQLALPDGEPIDQIHLTLAYLGDSRETALDKRAVKRALASFASESLHLQGVTGGLARFAASESSDNQSPIVALVQVPGLSKFREALVKRLEGVGVQIANDFDGFTPHITLKYVPADAEMPVDKIPSVPLTFDTLCLAIGDEHSYFKMGEEQYPQYWEENAHEQRTQQSQGAEIRLPTYPGRRNQQVAAVAERTGVAQLVEERVYPEASWDEGEAVPEISIDREKRVDIRRWRTRAIDDLKMHRPLRGFTSTYIPEYEHALISAGLARCNTVADVKNVFEIVRTGIQVMDEPQKVSRMGECQCEVCRANDGKPIEDGREPPFHSGCGCKAVEAVMV